MIVIRDPLIVYPSTETAFTGNGLRTLSPSVAEHTIEYGQAGSIHVEHPIDDGGAWRTLKLGEIIYAPVPYRGEIHWQPYRIYRRTKKRQSGSAVISVDAMHLFYDLNYVLLEDVRPTGLTCQQAIEWLFAHPYDPDGKAEANLPLKNFSFSSNVGAKSSAEYQWKTLTGALIGEDNCVATRWGGTLFVDGLRFSINAPMEGSRQDAFRISYGCNLVEVEEMLDCTSTYSQMVASDNFGRTMHASVPLHYNGLPFEKTLHASFSYSDSLTPQEQGARFLSDFGAYMSRIQEIDASYTVQHRDLTGGSPFSDLASYEVGDVGIIEDSDLEISTTQRIVKTVTDLLTGERIRTETGSLKKSIARKEPYSDTVTTTVTATQKQVAALTETVSDLDFAVTVPTPITTKDGAYLTTTGGSYLIYKKG